MTERIYLAADLGAESGRVMAGAWDGRRIKLEELHRFPNGPVEVAGSLRWDVEKLWAEVQCGLGVAAKRFGAAAASVGVDTWGVDYALLSREGELLGQPFNYRDARTRGLLAAALAKVPRAEIFSATGSQFLEINTLYQLLAAQRDQPDTLAAARCFLMMPDYFHWCLCGARVVEFTNATTTQFFHPTRRAWSFELLERFGLPTAMLPEVVAPGTRLGPLRAAVGESTGLGRLPVIAPATHDTGSAVAAVPTAHTGHANWAYLSSGTWSLLGFESREAVLSPRALALNVTNEGGLDGTYRVLKNIMGLWLVQRCQRAFAGRGHHFDYAELARLASAAPAFRSFIEPDDARFLHPPDMPAAIQQFCRETGQPVPETEGALVRCLYESLALKYATVLDELEELAAARLEVIHIVGGGSQNSLLNEFTASACARPVVSGPVEATALGNVLVQARAAGEIQSLDELRGVVRASSELREFVPGDPARWREARARFAKLLV